MIDPERLKPYITHEDRYLRRAAVEYFYDYWAQDGDLIPLVLQACRRWGPAETGLELSRCTHFRLTAEGLTELLDFLRHAADQATISGLNGILDVVPGEVVVAAEPAIRATANVRPTTLERLRRRASLARQTPEEVWQELQAFAARSEDKLHVGEIDHGYADDLVAALAPHPVPDNATLARMLQERREDPGWLPTFLIDLAGCRRVREAVPPLVGYLEIDTDYERERVNDALARINDAEAVRLIRARYEQWPWHSRLYAGTPLGTIKQPEAEDVLLALLAWEPELDLRTNLCHGLCKQFSGRGLEVVLRHARDGDYDPQTVDLRDEVLPVADLLSVPLPEADPWRRERDEQERRVQQRIAEMEAWARRAQEEKKRPPPRAPAPSDDFLAARPQPVRRGTERVGRNDPCPCGSGKKFKKCCGAR